MDMDHHIGPSVVIHLRSVHTSDRWTQQKRHYFQDQQQGQQHQCAVDQDISDLSHGHRDEEFAFHLLDIHAKFCIKPSCRPTVDGDIASTSESNEIPHSNSHLTHWRTNQSVSDIQGTSSQTTSTCRPVVRSEHRNSASKSKSKKISSGYALTDSRTDLQETSSHATSTSTRRTMVRSQHKGSASGSKSKESPRDNSGTDSRTTSNRSSDIHGTGSQTTSFPVEKSRCTRPETSDCTALQASQPQDDVRLQASESLIPTTVPGVCSEEPCPTTSVMETTSESDIQDDIIPSIPSGNHGNASKGWISEERSPDKSHDHTTGMITMEIKTEIVDDDAGEDDSWIAYQPNVNMESPDVSHDHATDGMAEYIKIEMKGETSGVMVDQSVEGRVGENRLHEVSIPGEDGAQYSAAGIMGPSCSSMSEDPGTEWQEYDIGQETREQWQCSPSESSLDHDTFLEAQARTDTIYAANICSICSKAFATKTSLRRHMRTHTGERPYKCNFCSKAFTQKSDLQRHVKIKHTGERPHKCSLCPKAFIEKYDLISHMRMHTGERPYKCNICSKAYTKNFILQKHILRIHTSEQDPLHSWETPFKCSMCFEAFTEKRDLQRHSLRMHTGGKPYKCNICTKACCTNFNLQRHMRTHTGEKPFKCSICSKAFQTKSYLNKHKTIKHAV